MCQVHEKVRPQVKSRDRYLVRRVNLPAPSLSFIIIKGVRKSSFDLKILSAFFTLATSHVILVLIYPFGRRRPGYGRQEEFLDEEGTVTPRHPLCLLNFSERALWMTRAGGDEGGGGSVFHDTP